MFLEEISIWMCRWVEKMPSPVWRAPSNLLRAQIEQNMGEGQILSFLKLRQPIFLPLDIRTPSSLAFRLQDLTPTPQLPTPPGLQTRTELYPRFSWFCSQTASRSWDFSASIIISWTNSHNQSPLTHLFLSYWFCFSGDPWLTHQWVTPTQRLPLVMASWWLPA